MSTVAVAVTVAASLIVAILFLQQLGRVLVRLEGIERDLLLLRNLLAPQSPNDSSTDTDAAAVKGSRINRAGLKQGSAAPDFTLPLLAQAGTISLSEYRGKTVLLIFLSGECQPCELLASRLAQLSRHPYAQRLLLIARGDAEAFRAKSTAVGLEFPTVVQSAWEVSRAYGTFQIPSAYCVGPDGRLTSGLVVGPDAIFGLACDVLAGGVAQQLSGGPRIVQSHAGPNGEAEVVA